MKKIIAPLMIMSFWTSFAMRAEQVDTNSEQNQSLSLQSDAADFLLRDLFRKVKDYFTRSPKADEEEVRERVERLCAIAQQNWTTREAFDAANPSINVACNPVQPIANLEKCRMEYKRDTEIFRSCYDKK